MTLPDLKNSQFILSPQDIEDALVSEAILEVKHRAVVSERGLRFLAEGAHIKRHLRDGAPLRPVADREAPCNNPGQ